MITSTRKGRAGRAVRAPRARARPPVGRTGVLGQAARSQPIGPARTADGRSNQAGATRRRAVAVRAGTGGVAGAADAAMPGPGSRTHAVASPGGRTAASRRRADAGVRRAGRPRCRVPAGPARALRRASPCAGRAGEAPQQHPRVEHRDERHAGPRADRRPEPSQSDTPGLSGYSVVSTTYMLRKVATPATTYAIRQRHENASRIAARPNSGNRYRSWTRVGTPKKARASTHAPTRIVSRSGRRATSTDAPSMTASSSVLPTTTAGTGPMDAHATASGIGASGIHAPFVARLAPPTSNRAQML